MSDLRLLLELEPRWESFKQALGPALRRSEARGEVEQLYTGIPKRSLTASYLMHAAVIFTYLSMAPTMYILWQAKFPPIDLKKYNHEVVYYAPLLPALQDARGAEEGKAGASGGRELYHPYQRIRIRRGKKLVEMVVDAPNLKLPRTDERVANLIALSGDHAPQGAPPPPSVSRQKLPRMPNIASEAVAPAPQVRRDSLNRSAELKAEVVPPAASVPQRAVPNATRTAYQAEVVPPVVAASRETQGTPKLTLPALDVVAPPVSANNIDSTRLNGPLVAGSQTFDVVAPAVRADAGSRGSGPSGIQQHYEIVGPAAQATGHGRNTNIAGLDAGVAAPRDAGPNGTPDGAQGGTGTTPGGGGTSTSANAKVVGDAGKANGGGLGSGIDGLIVSANPGSAMGLPNRGEPGTLAMSPNGGSTPGLGGSGGGASIGKGVGSGSGDEGGGPGSGKKGVGPGADELAKGGISPGLGPGGVGNGGKAPALAGVSISGNVVNIPSFNAAAASMSGVPNASIKEGERRTPPVVIVATPRSGGAMNQYGTLPGSRVYTIYVDLPSTVAVMQYADPASKPGFETELTAPEPIQTNFPAELKESQAVVACTLDRLGKLRQLRFLRAPSPRITEKLAATLKNWRFRPVLRGDEVIEVNAILGFGVNTN